MNNHSKQIYETYSKQDNHISYLIRYMNNHLFIVKRYMIHTVKIFEGNVKVPCPMQAELSRLIEAKN